MGYIAAVLLMYQEEEKAFKTLNALLINYNMKEFFLPGMPKLQRTFSVFSKLLK